MRCFRSLAVIVAASLVGAAGIKAEQLAGTSELMGDFDRSAAMRVSFRTFLQKQIDASVAARAVHWRRDFSSRSAYEGSVEPNRARLRTMVGVVDPRVPFPLGPELIASVDRSALRAETEQYTVHAVRWPVLAGVWAEGLLLRPRGPVIARLVALPDADQTPEVITGLSGPGGEAAFASRLAAAGCEVLVPVLIDRSDEFSGNAEVVFTNQPHREWVWRQAYQMGRHIVGYEVQKVLAAVDWFKRPTAANTPVGVVGYAEGGLVALFAAALDPRIDAVLVSGYFDSRQTIAQEPIYRDMFGLLVEFGDAEIASLIAPRGLVIECSESPRVDGPPTLRPGRRLAGAPGRIETPPVSRVRAEVARLRGFFPTAAAVSPRVEVIAGPNDAVTRHAGTTAALQAFLTQLGVRASVPDRVPVAPVAADLNGERDRQQRQLGQLVEYTQRLMRDSARVREKFWSNAVPKSAATWREDSFPQRERMSNDLIGRYAIELENPNARTRKIADDDRFTTYEVVLDTAAELFAWGYLLVPKDLRPGERRPVVVCQHGLEGVPADVVTEDPADRAFKIYQGFASRLAQRGFVVYAPHNYYRGGNEFRQLQRLAHPMGKTLFAVTMLQHAQHLRWLSELPFVDPKRIGFYGLSYGGNTAMRVPALLEQYAAVIASGDFNEWVLKNVTVDHIHSMMFNNVYEVYEWNLGHTFNHADMAALIAPRPFMVERGHDDGVARDEWVAAEYARVRRLYAKLGIPERTTIEFFNGPHMIHGVGTYAFLHRHLQWPEPAP